MFVAIANGIATLQTETEFGMANSIAETKNPICTDVRHSRMIPVMNLKKGSEIDEVAVDEF